MRHAILTCKNHPNLRWSTKEIAVSNGTYNGMRNIFFNGVPTGEGMYPDNSGLECTTHLKRADGGLDWVAECACPSSDLMVAPEDALVAK